MRWTIEYHPRAARDLARLPAAYRANIRRRIEALRERPYSRAALKVDDDPPTYRVRAGNYRFLYEVHKLQRLIRIMRVRHRREAYRRNPLWIPNPAVRVGRRPVELLTDRAKRYRYRPPSAVLIQSLSRSVQRLGEQRHRRHRADHQRGQHPWCDCSFPVHRNGDHIGMPLFPENVVTSHYMAHLESQFLKGLDCLTTRCGHLLSNRNNLFALDLGIGSRSPSSSVVSR